MEQNKKNRKRSTKFVAILLLNLFVALGTVSCISNPGTVTPPPIVDTQPSWDGNEQNSGILGFIDNEGFLITKNAADRYTNLTVKYGKDRNPPLSKGQGLVPKGDNFILPNQYMVEFIAMNQLFKSGK